MLDCVICNTLCGISLVRKGGMPDSHRAAAARKGKKRIDQAGHPLARNSLKESRMPADRFISISARGS